MGRLRRAGNLHHRPRRQGCLQAGWARYAGKYQPDHKAGDREGAGELVTYSSAGAGSAAYRISSGYCRAANTKVIGTKPNSLKLTQKSVDCVRHIASFRTASARKNSAQRKVSLRQPSGVRWNIESNRIARNGFSKM